VRASCVRAFLIITSYTISYQLLELSLHTAYKVFDIEQHLTDISVKLADLTRLHGSRRGLTSCCRY